MSELQDYFRRVRDGELVVDRNHPAFGFLDVAIQRFNSETVGSDIVPPPAERDLLNAISTAAIQEVIREPRAGDLLRSEPGQPEEPFVSEVRRLIVTPPRNPATTVNIQGDVIINNAMREIDSKKIPEQSK
jgi:hypothetical protein